MAAKQRWLLALAAVALAALGTVVLWTQLQPRYCWLVFGPDGAERVLLQVDAQGARIDLNRDGRFDPDRERFADLAHCTNVVIPSRQGNWTQTIESIRPYEDQRSRRLILDAQLRGPCAFQQLADVGLGRCPGAAPEAHFRGPLTVQAQSIDWRVPPGLALQRGDKPTDLRALVGTLDARRGCWTVVRSHAEADRSAFPTNVHPEVLVEFPPRATGQPPIRVLYPLNKFC